MWDEAERQERKRGQENKRKEKRVYQKSKWNEYLRRDRQMKWVEPILQERRVEREEERREEKKIN